MPEATERELAREAAQLRIAERDDSLTQEERAGAARAHERIVTETEWSSAANVLAADLGFPPERYEPGEDVECARPDGLRVVEKGGGSR